MYIDNEEEEVLGFEFLYGSIDNSENNQQSEVKKHIKVSVSSDTNNFDKKNNSELIPLDPTLLHNKLDVSEKYCPKCGNRYYGNEYIFCIEDGCKLEFIWKCKTCQVDFSLMLDYSKIDYCPTCGEKLGVYQGNAINSITRPNKVHLVRKCQNKSCCTVSSEKGKFCRKCGSQLMEMKCSNCGQPIRQKPDGDFDIYCPICGSPNEEEKKIEAKSNQLFNKILPVVLCFDTSSCKKNTDIIFYHHILKSIVEAINKKTDVDIKISLITCGDSKAEIVVPFSGSGMWNIDKWIIDMFQKVVLKKTILYGFFKAIEIIEDLRKSYRESGGEIIKPIVVFISDEALSSESRIERLKMSHRVRFALKEYKNIVIDCSNGYIRNKRFAGFQFPYSTYFFRASDVIATLHNYTVDEDGTIIPTTDSLADVIVNEEDSNANEEDSNEEDLLVPLYDEEDDGKN